MYVQAGSLFVSTVLVALTFINGGSACLSAFKNIQNITYVQRDCTNNGGFSSIPSADQLANTNFDDKCLSKCIVNGLQMVDNEGQIDKDFLLDFMELNAPDSYLLKLSELATSCIESSGADKIDGGSKTGKSLAECMPMKQFYSCFLQGAEKLC